MLTFLKNSLWHPALAFVSAALNGFPARSMTVIGVTGTKGKSTMCEMLSAAFTAAGHQTAVASTIRFAYPGVDERNMFKMTMPGRGYLQGFLAKARRAGATHAVIEITSEGARQHRHDFLFLDGLVVTNIHKEHIESHGSFEAYADAKRSLFLAHGHTGLVKKLDWDGNVLGETGGQGKTLGRYGEAHYIAVSKRGEIFVTDTLNWRVQKYVKQ